MKLKIAVSLTILAVLLGAGAYLFKGPGGPVLPSSALLKPANASEILAAVKNLNSPLVLVNFWASWCEPCKKEFPSILSLRQKLKPQGLEVVFVSIDEPGDFQAAEDFLREHNVDFQTYYKGSQGLAVVNQIFPKWQGAVPTTVLLGAKLQIVDAWEGDATLAEFQKRVLEHLKGT
jgi:thiol-disulfide isomerase/thioredoxin